MKTVTMGFFRHPGHDGSAQHEACGYRWHDHGWIDSHDVGGDGITVCPALTGPFNPPGEGKKAATT